MRWGAVAGALVFLLAANRPQPASAYDAKGFIRVCNGRFVDESGKAFYTAGYNGYTDLLNAAYDHLYNGQPDRVDARFKEARRVGLTTVRIWGHGDGVKTTLQPEQGRYDGKVFRALDYVIFKARKYNVRVFISFSTYWQNADGILAYAKWAGLRYPVKQQTPYYTEQWAAKDKFWTSALSQKYYMAHMNVMFNRINTFSKVRYKEDWAIFAWNLFNEPRCPASQMSKPCTSTITKWGEKMFRFAKQHNKKQLFTFGEEGFFSKDGPLGRRPDGAKWYAACNPFGVPKNVEPGWASRVGQDFSSQQRLADFASFHLWPNNWNTFSVSFADKWIRCHINACNLMKKPCLLGEFGRALPNNEGKTAAIASARNPYFKTVYATIRKAVIANDNISGSLFWRWVNYAPVSPGNENAVSSRDSTFKSLITPHAQYMKAKSGMAICKPRG